MIGIKRFTGIGILVFLVFISNFGIIILNFILGEP